MNKRKNEYYVPIVTAVVILALVTVSLVFYNNNLQSGLTQATCNTLEEIMLQQAYNFASKLKGDMSAMQAMANLYSHENSSEQEQIDVLQELVEDTPFDTMIATDTMGNALTSTGVKVYIGDREYFSEVMSTRKPVVSKPLNSRLAESKVVVLVGAPIIRDGEIIGILAGSYDVNELNKLFLSSFGGRGYAFITDRDGDVIARTVNNYTIFNDENLFDGWEKAKFYEFDDIKSIKRNIYENIPGHARYMYNGSKRLIHYTPIGINNWVVFSIVPDEVISENSNWLIAQAAILTSFVFILFAAVMVWVVKIFRQNLANVSHIAFVDELTGARNLNKFKLDAQELLNSNKGTSYLIIKLDIENFKLVNEIHGFEQGDLIIVNMAKAMQAVIDEQKELYARVGVDEFALLLLNRSETALHSFNLTVRAKFNRLMDADYARKICLQIGLYKIEPDETDINLIFEKVNYAHKAAKHNKGNSLREYDGVLRKTAIREKEIEDKMENALKNEEFVVFLQPKYRLSDETPVGAESLVRWRVNGGDVEYPGSFIPVFEKNGFITSLDMYMFDKTCRIIRGWLDSDITPVIVSVNFSRLHLNNPNFIDELCAIADKRGAPRKYLEIELTETVIFDNIELLESVLDKLHQAGFTLSMDDFGTGYSSLGLLKNIPVDVIKMDRAFFVSTKDEQRAKAVISSVMDMAKKLNIHTVAEGVETQENIDLLRELGCDIVQGYYYAKPMPAEEIRELLAIKR